jgi:hypothetical protein
MLISAAFKNMAHLFSQHLLETADNFADLSMIFKKMHETI